MTPWTENQDLIDKVELWMCDNPDEIERLKKLEQPDRCPPCPDERTDADIDREAMGYDHASGDYDECHEDDYGDIEGDEA